MGNLKEKWMSIWGGFEEKHPKHNFIYSSPLIFSVVSKTTCFFVSKSYKNLDFKGNLQ